MGLIILKCSKYITHILMFVKKRILFLYEQEHYILCSFIQIITTIVVFKLYVILYYLTIVFCMFKLLKKGDFMLMYFFIKIRLLLLVFVLWTFVPIIFNVWLFICYLLYHIITFVIKKNNKLTFLEYIDALITNKMLRRRQSIKELYDKYLK